MHKFIAKTLATIIILSLFPLSSHVIELYKSHEIVSDFEHENPRYESTSFYEILKTKYYILKIDDSDFIDDYRYGEAVGFLTENVKSQSDLINRFPYGVFKTKKLISELKHRIVIAPYGEFNNNYLTPDYKLIYSDDSEMLSVTRNALVKSNVENFVEVLAEKLKMKWKELKDSGEYGNQGTDYGKRGYSKNTLRALSEIDPKSNKYASKDFENYLGNGSILRAWVIGADKRLTSEKAFELGREQSKITHPNEDVSFAAGVVSYWFSVKNDCSSKAETIAKVIEFANGVNPNSRVTYSLIKGKEFAELNVDPIILFTNISGFKYDEFLLLLVYSYLYFDTYFEALKYIVHTTGDNDSLAFVLGAFLNYEYSQQNNNLVAEFIELP